MKLRLLPLIVSASIWVCLPNVADDAKSDLSYNYLRLAYVSPDFGDDWDSANRLQISGAVEVGSRGMHFWGDVRIETRKRYLRTRSDTRAVAPCIPCRSGKRDKLSTVSLGLGYAQAFSTRADWFARLGFAALNTNTNFRYEYGRETKFDDEDIGVRMEVGGRIQTVDRLELFAGGEYLHFMSDAFASISLGGEYRLSGPLGVRLSIGSVADTLTRGERAEALSMGMTMRF